MKWLVGIVILVVIVFGLLSTLPAEKEEEEGTGGAPAIAGLSCKNDNDCVPNMDSISCCSAKDYSGEIQGQCPTEQYKGSCSCRIPAGWSEGQCNGLKERTEPPDVIGNATPRIE